MRAAILKLAEAPESIGRNGDANKLSLEDRPAHRWYRFVLSFPPHLVRHYIEEFRLGPGHRVLDPFCGTGTTVVECRKLGLPSVGIEANPMAFFATSVKTNWSIDPARLLKHANGVAERVRQILDLEGIDDDEPFFGLARTERNAPLRKLARDSERLLLKKSISPLPLHKTLVLLEELDRTKNEGFLGHERLALAKALVNSISNLHFGPEVGVGRPKRDAPVLWPWLDAVREMSADICELERKRPPNTELFNTDARSLKQVVKPRSIDAVITSPPYPNEKDYTRTTRLEAVMLGFLRTKAQLRAMKQSLIRSNTRNVFKQDDDDVLVSEHREIQRIASDIEARRIAMGKTSGFERLYARVTKLYFGGMLRHLAELRPVLKPGAMLAYVVGDQASYLRVMIRTGELLADIARSLGYELVKIDLFRTRLATATREQLREEVVVLRWPGNRRGDSR